MSKIRRDGLYQFVRGQSNQATADRVSQALHPLYQAAETKEYPLIPYRDLKHDEMKLVLTGLTDTPVTRLKPVSARILDHKAKDFHDPPLIRGRWDLDPFLQRTTPKQTNIRARRMVERLISQPIWRIWDKQHPGMEKQEISTSVSTESLAVSTVAAGNIDAIVEALIMAAILLDPLLEPLERLVELLPGAIPLVNSDQKKSEWYVLVA